MFVSWKQGRGVSYLVSILLDLIPINEYNLK